MTDYDGKNACCRWYFIRKTEFENGNLHFLVAPKSSWVTAFWAQCLRRLECFSSKFELYFHFILVVERVFIVRRSDSKVTKFKHCFFFLGTIFKIHGGTCSVKFSRLRRVCSVKFSCGFSQNMFRKIFCSVKKLPPEKMIRNLNISYIIFILTYLT